MIKFLVNSKSTLEIIRNKCTAVATFLINMWRKNTCYYEIKKMLTNILKTLIKK